jgi:hypothetical protein
MEFGDLDLALAGRARRHVPRPLDKGEVYRIERLLRTHRVLQRLVQNIERSPDRGPVVEVTFRRVFDQARGPAREFENRPVRGAPVAPVSRANDSYSR